MDTHRCCNESDPTLGDNECTIKCQVNAHGRLHDFDPKMGWGGGGVCFVQATFGA